MELTVPTLPRPLLTGLSLLSKFTVSDHPEALPNKCAGCGIGHGEPGRRFIDLALDVDYYGVVYLCTICFHEVANILGYASYMQQVSIVDSFHKLIETCSSLKEENELLRSTVASLSGHRCGPFAVPVLDEISFGVHEEGVGEEVVSPSSEGEQSSRDDSAGVEEGSDAPESDIVEGPANDGGPAKSDRKPGKPRDIADSI